MKVLLSCLSAGSGGALCYLRHMLPLLHRRFAACPDGNTLHVLGHAELADVLTSLPDDWCTVIDEPPPAGYRRWRWVNRQTAATCRAQKADVLFVPYQIAPRVKGMRRVLMIRNMEPFFNRHYCYHWKNALRNVVLRHASIRNLRQADRVIAVSDYVRQFSESALRIPSSHLRTIPHGRDVCLEMQADEQADRLVLRKLGIEGDFIFTSGSLLPYRRAEDIIEAFAAAWPAGSSPVRLVIAGDGTDVAYKRHVRQVADAGGVGGRVLFLGHVDVLAMRALYRQCRVFATATEIEACPNIAIEALTSRCVIVAGDQPVLRECLGDAALWVTPRDRQQWHDALLAAFQNNDIRRSLRDKTVEQASRFCWQTCADETFAALTQW